MDDVDSVQAQIARNMLQSDDWVTARLDGIKYLEKAPLWYWLIAAGFKTLGVADWVARIPVVLSIVLLCWCAMRAGKWAAGERTGFYAGLILATSTGMYLFTRILIPDVCLTLAITVSLWGFLRAIDQSEPHPRWWAAISAASIGVGILLKGLIAAVFPIGICLVFLLLTGLWKDRVALRRLHIPAGILIVLIVATPWHVLATLRNPPHFVWTMHSGPGEYKGFFWFYFFNEHLLRFLNLRFPRDYNTVPRFWFWALHIVWLFPWSLFLPGVFRLSYRGRDRPSRFRLLSLVWIGFVLIFFTFSTTQEYYSMPCYPAFAFLIASGLAADSERDGFQWSSWGLRSAGTISALCCVACAIILWQSLKYSAPGDISRALTQHPDAYTLSLGHMGDLTLASFAYLRIPLALASVAFAVGAVGVFSLRSRSAYLALAAMMALFFQAANRAMVAFDPYLSSRTLANALLHSPPGDLILGDQYYTFSSVIFYTNRQALLLNGRVNNLEYGSNEPRAPNVFINDDNFQRLWSSPKRFYLLAEKPMVARLAVLVGPEQLHTVAESGGKYLLSNE